MKERKLMHRVAAVLCALVMTVSVLGVSVPYYANENDWYIPSNAELVWSNLYSNFAAEYSTSYGYENNCSLDNMYSFISGAGGFYVLIGFGSSSSTYYLYASNYPLAMSSAFYVSFLYDWQYPIDFGSSIQKMWVTKDNGATWSLKYHYENSTCVVGSSSTLSSYKICSHSEFSGGMVEANHYVAIDSSSVALPSDTLYSYYWAPTVNFDGTEIGSESYNSTLGYLQNVKENRVYDKVPLGEVVNDKFTARWYFDQFTTTGVDLSSDDYFINYYQERWLVKGYGDDDVIEKSDRYLLASYVIPEGYYIETYSEDIDGVLAGQGYEPPTSFDLLFHKFVVTHHYFQVVDAANNQVGGYLHVYYTDDTGAFGVEYIGETLNDKGEFDEDGYKEVIGEDSITSDDTDAGFEDLEDGTGVDFGDIDGVNDFSGILINYAESVAGFGNALGAFLSAFPPWVLVSVGLAACLLVAGIVFKVLAG